MAKLTKSLGKICKVRVLSVNAVFLTSIFWRIVTNFRQVQNALRLKKKYFGLQGFFIAWSDMPSAVVADAVLQEFHLPCRLSQNTFSTLAPHHFTFVDLSDELQPL